jgi:hypothetical protein
VARDVLSFGAEEIRMRNLHRNLGLVACVALATGWTACSATVVSEKKEDDPSTSTSQLMRRAASCEDLEQALKADARARLKLMMEQNDVDDSEDWGTAGGTSADAGAPGMGGSGGFAGSGGATAGGSGGGSAGGFGGGQNGTAGGPGDFTGTNTQVANVDEADFVKTDGTRIFQLRDRMLHTAKAWPVAEAALQSSVQIEGQPLEMFLVGDAGAPDQKLVVYSLVDGTDIYNQAGIELPSEPAPTDPWGVGGSGGSGWDEPYQPPSSVQLTKITVVSVAGASPSVLHELYFDGSYVSSRRSDLHVRTVLSVPGNMPELRTTPTAADRQKAEMLVISRLLKEGKELADIPSDELDAMVREALGEVLVQENEFAIESITYQDWLPRVFTKPGGQVVATSVACESFYIPKPGTSQLGITHVAPLDLDDLSAPSTGTAILGVAETMYQNASTMVLATSTFDGNWDAPTWSTYVHRFDVEGLALPAYEASGVVEGRIHGQFAIDEKGGFVRVVTTTGEAWSAQETANHLFTLEVVDGELKVAGDAGGFGHNEQVYAVRFVGDTAYVVTFRQTDPLFAIDVADARAPKILGALHIPGFSEYMHPLGANHLLTVGRDADPSTGWSQNLALQVFDVTDKMHPQLAHKHVFASYGNSTAEYDHKAFTFFEDRKLLAIPYMTETYDEVTWNYRVSSSMELFRVDAQEGITPVGALSGDPLLSDAERDPEHYACYPYGYETGSSFQRGIFMDDVIFGVARDGFVAAKVAAPAQPLAVVHLSDPTVVPPHCYPNEGYGGMGGSGGGTGGTGGSEWDGGVGGAGGEWDDAGVGGAGGEWADAGIGGSAGSPWDGGAAGSGGS